MKEISEETNKKEIRDERLQWLRELEIREEQALRESEWKYNNSGGFGKRSGVTFHENQLKLIRLALEGVSHQCPACSLHLRNGMAALRTIEDLKKAGQLTMTLDRVREIINSIL